MAGTPMRTPKKFAMQQVFEILLRKPVDNSIIGYLTDTKTSGLENTMEMVYPTGGRGNVYIGNGFAHSRKATLNVTMATWNTDVLAIQNGTEVYTGSAYVTYYDVMEVTSDNQAVTKFTAIGETNQEVGYVYKLADDGTYEASFKQATGLTSNGDFTYSTESKTIAFKTDDPSAPKKGNYVACAYKFKSADNAQRISIQSDGIPPKVLVSAYGLASDICSGELFPALIEGAAQVNGNWNFDLSADGEPVVQNLSMEFVKGCYTKELYSFTIFTEDEATE